VIIEVFVSIILPIFAVIGVGALMGRLFSLDAGTLSKLNFYVFVPAILLSKILDSDLDPARFGTAVVFVVIHLLLMLAVSLVLFSLGPLKVHRRTLTLGALFYNAGNYGLPLAQLAFGEEALGIMAFVVMVQNLASFTLGLWLVADGRQGWRGALKQSLKAPAIYATLIGLMLNTLGIVLPRPVRIPVDILADGLIPVALLTLGVQLSQVRISSHLGALSALAIARLLLSPLLAAGLAAVGQVLLPETLAVAPVLVVAAGLPVAVNVYILSAEYDREPELASQMVFWTTLVSALTVTAWLVLYR
jgi:predicted permease